MPVAFTINGNPVEVTVEPRTSLADCLRYTLRLTGTHVGCEHGVCGACTVIVDGAAVRACLMLAVQAEGSSIITVEGLSQDDSLTPLQTSFRKHHAYGTAAAHVAVDPGTGRVELVDYLVVEDVGRIVNPLTLHGQVIGATVQGLGGAFMENLVYDANGQLLAGNLADYLIPTATDFPRIRAISLQHRPSPTNPLGVKGAGEGGIIPVGGLMANAVAGALSSLGAEPDELPLSPPRVWRLANPS